MAIEAVEQGTVNASGELIHYEIRTVDARSTQRQAQDARRGRPEGNIVVVVPGHGQSVHGPKKLVATAARLSKSGIVWCVDPVPARGGDRVEAQAIAHIVRSRIGTTFPATEEPITATLIGWSHGGGEALRAAEYDPDLFPQFLGLCPTGFVDRPPFELVYSFLLESVRILWSSARRKDWLCLKDTLRLGGNFVIGSLRDLWRSGSGKRLVEDIGWAARRASLQPLGYTGEVVLLFGAQDTVIRWRDVFPECEQPQDIAESLADLQRRDFPRAASLQVRIVAGTHVAPEVDAPAFLELGLGLLGQLGQHADFRQVRWR